MNIIRIYIMRQNKKIFCFVYENFFLNKKSFLLRKLLMEDRCGSKHSPSDFTRITSATLTLRKYNKDK